MESVKQDIPDTLWIGFGRKDAPIVQDKARFLKYFHSWMHPYKFRVKHVEFWPGFSWGTVKVRKNTIFGPKICKITFFFSISRPMQKIINALL